jgi:hypothetical protein
MSSYFRIFFLLLLSVAAILSASGCSLINLPLTVTEEVLEDTDRIVVETGDAL